MEIQVQKKEEKKESKSLEYLVVSDTNSKVLLSTSSYQEAKRLASQISQAGGACTIFKSIK